jgi:serine protease Do
MNTAIFSKSGGYMGVGFAIPSNLARAIADQLLASGKVSRGYIGLTVQPLTADIAETLGLNENQGVLVNQVNGNSPAERAGLKPGDVLLSLDGAPLTDGGQYRNRAALAKPGSTVAVDLIRDGRRLQVAVKVAHLDEEALQGVEAARILGVAVRGLGAEEARRLRLAKAVRVTAVERDSLAALAGIAPGTLILEVNREPVGSPGEFAAALGKANGSALLRLLENGQSRHVTLRWR